MEMTSKVVFLNIFCYLMLWLTVAQGSSSLAPRKKLNLRAKAAGYIACALNAPAFNISISVLFAFAFHASVIILPQIMIEFVFRTVQSSSLT
jgi:hypothetical protein